MEMQRQTCFGQKKKPKKNGETGLSTSSSRKLIRFSSSGKILYGVDGETGLSALLISRSPSRQSSSRCIFFGVPNKLREIKKEFYTPQAVSIGPFHYKKTHLHPTQPIKYDYSSTFFDRTSLAKSHYYKKAKEWEEQARGSYKADISLNSDEFAAMLLVDGIFIIEFFQRMRSLANEHDAIFKNPILRDYIFIDLILFENQLPFDVLHDIYSPSDWDYTWEDFLFWIAGKYFRSGVSFEKVKETLKNNNIWHLVDFLHLLCIMSIPRKKVESEHESDFKLPLSATELHEAGVKFVMAASKHPFDLNFTRDGSLEIPRIFVDRWSEYFYRNFIAHEHCLQKQKIISSYVILVAALLKTPKDVDLLVRLKFIDNQSLRTNEDVCNLFKNFYNKSMMDRKEFYYASLCDDMNEYCNNQWHQWRAAFYRWGEMLKFGYFRKQLKIICAIAGYVLLIVTIIQAVYSVIAA